MKLILTLWLVVCFIVSSAQIPDYVYRSNIRSITLTRYADIYSYPVMALNSADQFELHFDDMDNDVKSYYYTYLLCNADWTPSTLFTFDYIRGFQNVRISDYRTSSIAITRYTHYQAVLPDRNCVPVRSGNYLSLIHISEPTRQAEISYA